MELAKLILKLKIYDTEQHTVFQIPTVSRVAGKLPIKTNVAYIFRDKYYQNHYYFDTF